MKLNKKLLFRDATMCYIQFKMEQYNEDSGKADVFYALGKYRAVEFYAHKAGVTDEELTKMKESVSAKVRKEKDKKERDLVK